MAAAPPGRPQPTDRHRHRFDVDRLVPLGLAVAALVAYQAAATRFPVEWDGAQLVLGLDRFDVTSDTPHAPGYWLYVAAGRVVRALTPLDGTASLTLVSSLAAAATVGLTHALGRAVGGRLLGAVAAGLVATNPFFWFYASSVATYPLDALACVALASLAWHARPGSAHGLAAAATLGLAAGFRQTSLLLFAPLAVVAMARSTRLARAWVAGAVVGAASVLAWFIPMLVEQPGGFGAWRGASDALLAGSVELTSVFTGAAEVVNRNMTQSSSYALIAFLPALLVAAVAGIGWALDRRPLPLPGRRRPAWASAPAVTLAAALPPLAFLVFVHFGKAGYLLAALPAGVVLLVLPARSLAGAGRAVVAVVATVVCLLSAQRFVGAPAIVPDPLLDAAGPPWLDPVNGAPYPFTHEAMVASDRITTRQLALADRFDPDTDVLVWGWLNGGERYRHATLTLPHFLNAFVQDSVHVHTAREGRWTTDPDTQVEVPPGGRAVFVLDHVPPDLRLLLDQGLATVVRVAPGLTVWVVEPGVTLLGVEVVEGDTTV